MILIYCSKPHVATPLMQACESAGVHAVKVTSVEGIRRVAPRNPTAAVVVYDGLDRPIGEILHALREERIARIDLYGPARESADRQLALAAGFSDAWDHAACLNERILTFLTSRLPLSAKRTPVSGGLQQPMIEFGELTIDVAYRRCLHQGRLVRISESEMDMLVCLAHAHPFVARREDLANSVNDASLRWIVGSRMVDMTVSKLRRKLGPAGVEFLSVRGQGYRIVVGGRGQQVAKPVREIEEREPFALEA